MERRQFLYGVVATGAAALGASTIASAAGASTGPARVPADSAEAWLLATGRAAAANH